MYKEDLRAMSTRKGKKRDYFGKFRLVLKLMGMSLEENLSLPYRVFYFVLLFSTIFCYSVMRIWELFYHDTETVLNIILFPYATVLSFAKSAVLIRNRLKLAKLFDKLEREPFLPSSKRGNKLEEEKLMNDCIRIIKIQSIIYMGGVFAFTTFVGIFTLIMRVLNGDYHKWEFPLGPMVVFNTTYSPNYEIWWFYETLSTFIIGTHFSVADSIVAAVLTYVTFQFKILQNNIRRIVEISRREMLKECDLNSKDLLDASEIPWKYMKKFLVQAVNYHLEIIHIANEMEEIFNGFLLFLFLNAVGLMGIMVQQTTVLSKPSACLVCLNLLASCFWGQQIIHESQEVGRAAFEAQFVGTDVRFQKSLALIIRRSQNPATLTAGKFTVVSLSTFTWVLRTGFSASTVLRQVK